MYFKSDTRTTTEPTINLLELGDGTLDKLLVIKGLYTRLKTHKFKIIWGQVQLNLLINNNYCGINNNTFNS